LEAVIEDGMNWRGPPSALAAAPTRIVLKINGVSRGSERKIDVNMGAYTVLGRNQCDCRKGGNSSKKTHFVQVVGKRVVGCPGHCAGKTTPWYLKTRVSNGVMTSCSG